MREAVPIFLRAHTERVTPTHPRERARSGARANRAPGGPRWPEYALVFDCETTLDPRQTLTIGVYRFCRAHNGSGYVCLEEGLFYDDAIDQVQSGAPAILEAYIPRHAADTPSGCPSQIRLLSRSAFLEDVFWRAVLNAPHGAGALAVAFNLPFDLSRLAVDCRKAKRRKEGWSLVVSQDTDPVTGAVRDNPLRPRIIVTPKDSKAAFVRLAGVGVRSKRTGKRLKPYTRGRFLDLRTLGWVLRSESYSLKNACQAFRCEPKGDYAPTGQVSVAEIDYCRQDVRATVALLNAMRTEFDRHPV